MADRPPDRVAPAARQVVFLHMPLAAPTFPNLAAHLLAETLRQQGEAAAVCYGTTRMHRTPVFEAYVHSVAGAAIFAPYLVDHPDPAAHAAALAGCPRSVDELRESIRQVARETRDRSWRWLPADRLGLDPNTLPEPAALRDPSDQLVQQLTGIHIALAGLCLRDMLRDLSPGQHDIYAFSVTFDSQKVASLALARLLKAREPACQVVFGGSGCDGPMGNEILRSFPFVDAVYQGEADHTVGRLVAGLRGEAPLEEVPGVLLRRDGRLVRTGPAPLARLDESPMPRYDGFVSQLRCSDWRDEDPFILFEASRGCWWGEKHHCRFCGLRADSMVFRRKQRARVLSEVEWLASRHPDHKVLYATDAILDHREIPALLAGFRDLRRTTPLRLFFEIKSTIPASQVAAMAAAGVTTVQPGIESFSDHILALMDKGATGLRQVQLLKWLDAYGIDVIYNLLLGTPGETAQDYREAVELVGALHHLTPPGQVGFLSLDRFSPYFQDPQRYGLTEVVPEAGYALQFLDQSVRLPELAYRFEFHAAANDDPALREARAQLWRAVETWRARYPQRGLWVREVPGGLEIVERDGATRCPHLLQGTTADLYRYLAECRSFTAINRAFPGIAGSALRACLAIWISRGWAARSSPSARHESYLSLALPVLAEPTRAGATATAAARPLVLEGQP